MKKNRVKRSTEKDRSEGEPISRREFLGRSALGLAGLTLGTLGTNALAHNMGAGNHSLADSRPNILLMVADDAGWRDVGYHDSEIVTPNIDKLTKEGVELNDFYVCPTCSPTRASLLTGRPASRFGIFSPIGGRSRLALPKDTATLAELLKENGYATAITGKWHLGLRPEVGPNHYGFEHAYGYLHGQIDQYTHVYKNGDRSWYRNGKFIDEEGHATDLITREASRFITELRDKSKPFFLYVPFSVPHYPLQEEDKWVEPYKKLVDNKSRQLFDASVAHMDDSIGKLLNLLKKEGLEDNTLVIFISDNGGQENWYPKNEYNGEHGPYDRLGDNRPLRDWKGSIYEGGIRVPAIFRWKGKLAPRKVNQITDVIDIYPTLAYLAGAQITPQLKIEGENIWKTLSEGKPLAKRVFYWRTNGQMAVRDGDWKLIHTGKKPDEGSNELYNVKTDPYEKKDVAAGNPQIVQRLLVLLKEQFSKDMSKKEAEAMWGKEE